MKSFNFFFVISLFLISENIFAQRTPEKCILITQHGDTLKGLLDNKKWIQNPIAIEFKDDTASNYKTFTPKEIKFILTQTGNRYIGVTMQVDYSAYRLEELIPDAGRDVNISSIFLLTLVSGNLNLYMLNDKGSKLHFFIQHQNDSILELINWQHLITSDRGEKILRTDEIFKGQLVSAIKDCSLFSNSIPELFYSQKSLMKIVIDYNLCFNNDKSKIYTIHFQKWKFKPGIIIGDRNGIQQKSNSLYVALSMNAIAPGLNEKLSWRNEVGLFFSKPYIFPKFNSMVEYNLALSQVKPFLDFGISLAYSEKAGNGIISGFGFTNKHFALEIRYELNHGINGLFIPKRERNDAYYFIGSIRF